MAMLVVISDLHFEEERSEEIGSGPGALVYRRNLPAAAFERVFAQLALQAQQARASKLDLVLAGDIFDLHRTQLWFRDPAPLRPYTAASEVGAGSALEGKLLAILDAIAAEPDAKACLAVIRNLANRTYKPGAGQPEVAAGFPVPVTIHYLPGNHDRLSNATPRIRETVRGLLGVEGGDAPLPHTFAPEDPRVLVRHGHEYDPMDFGHDYSAADRIPSHVPDRHYDLPTFGDFVTVDVASRLPHEFRAVYGDEEIAKDPVLSQLYLRLLEFDDLRPQSALLEFLLTTQDGIAASEIWSRIWPPFSRLLDGIRRDPFLHGQLRALAKRSPLFLLFSLILKLRVWRFGLPLPVARFFSWLANHSGAGGGGPEQFAAREDAIRKGQKRFLIAGHTHEPQVANLRTHSADRADRLYVDTGTWRNRLIPDEGNTRFADLKALTYVIVYASDEDRSAAAKAESFDYWSGFTQRWQLGKTPRREDRNARG